ncbi:MAG: large conductance mechanosensitive channel protein MscL [Candidatus Nanopelagicales bacterium]|nr:large conductance mechanosensitive channel protein MscL [Candidatus Nanopelagicales bacterium]
MITGFRNFITRGNVLDLAVAFVAGAAFSALVVAFTEAFITPLINLVLGGGVDAGQIIINDQTINISLMVNAVITFVITLAIIYFAFVVPMNRWRERQEAADAVEAAGPSAQELLLTEIRDLLAAERRSTS